MIILHNGWNGLPIVAFGTGAMSREVEFIIKRINFSSYSPVFDFIGFVSSEKTTPSVVCDDTGFDEFSNQFPMLGVVLPFADGVLKKDIFNKIHHINHIVFPNIIDPSAQILDSSLNSIAIGNIVECGAIINRNSCIGSFNLININSVIGHDSVIGNFCTINPGAILSGNVTVGDNVLIGAGAIVKQNVKIGENAVLGLGGFTVKDIEPNQIMVCDYAHELERGD